jgi:GxxExxY protein
MRVDRQKPLPIVYKDLLFDEGFRIDLLVEEKVVVELKCVEKILPIHEAQIYTYLKLSGNKIGLLINFNTNSTFAPT